MATLQSVIDSKTGQTYCPESDRAVVLRDVDSQGRAFCEFDVTNDDAEAIMVSADGNPITAPTAAGIHAPLGFLEGDLAIHYDRHTGIVAANQLKICPSTKVLQHT
ncbi:hypothetical protein ACFQ3B_01080 [Stackebrandtia endophytica]|uniref:hypothetical protein n=1 Tax=Stackebrandtia endophytica TaxID=1496996 RepID=UPI0011520FB6|nr:hypothetical protein [Stackebrandtia endophytica]